jgi:hypothetical protein
MRAYFWSPISRIKRGPPVIETMSLNQRSQTCDPRPNKFDYFFLLIGFLSHVSKYFISFLMRPTKKPCFKTHAALELIFCYCWSNSGTVVIQNYLHIFNIKLQCPPLNRITLGQHRSDNNNRMIQLTDAFCALLRYNWKSNII